MSAPGKSVVVPVEGVEIGEEFDNAAHCVTLAECPPGLFLWNGTLGFKSEYGAMEPDDATNGKHWKVGNRADAYCADSGEYFWGGTSTHDDRAKVLVYPIDAGKVAMVASRGPAALAPRHEAPADPFAAEDACLACHEAPAEGAGDLVEGITKALTSPCAQQPEGQEYPGFVILDVPVAHKIIAALRARSSAPEAREEALGNLLAVIHSDGGHRALEIGTKQAALEAEKIVARLLSSAPEAREDAQPFAWAYRLNFPDENTAWDWEAAKEKMTEAKFGQHGGILETMPLYTHPAAPSADKLRIAVEALEKISTGTYEQGRARTIARNALAALKAEG